MAWYDNESPKYVEIFTIEEYSGRYSAQASNGIFHKTELLLNYIIKNIDNSELVKVESPRYNGKAPHIFGARPDPRYMEINVLESDIENIGTDKPVHVKCVTELGLKSKEEFISILQIFTK